MIREKKDLEKLNSMNEFDRLVENLLTGELGLRHLEIAYAEYIRRNPALPEGVKSLLVKYSDNDNGLLHGLWMQIGKAVGTAELCFRRGEIIENTIQ